MTKHFFSVRLLYVLRGHSVVSSPPQRSMTSDFEGFSIPDFIHYIYFPVLDWGLNPGPPALDTRTLPLGYRGFDDNALISHIFSHHLSNKQVTKAKLFRKYIRTREGFTRIIITTRSNISFCCGIWRMT